MGMVADYGDEHIRTLDWKEHIRRRPGMYIGKLGDGTSADDGIYILIKEVLDNSVDEYMMGFGKSIDITIADDKTVTVRDYGRGVPLGKLVDVASKMNTGAKYDSKAFKKSVGLNGVGIKAVNALSDAFLIRSVRDGEARSVRFEKGNEIADVSESGVGEKNGTMVSFHADESVFGSYDFHMEYVESMVRNYTYLNAGLTIRVNGQAFVSKNGLLDLLQENLGEEPLYPPVHLCGEDIEVVITHGHGYGETYYSFVNGQHTTQGGTHQTAFREGIAKTIKEFYKKDYDAADVRTSVIAAISVKVEEPMFESQTKTKLGSKEMGPNGPTVRNFIVDFLKTELDNFLHKHPETADILQKKIQENEKERKAISGIQKKAREMAKKVSLNNKKLRDCRIHLTDKNDRAEESMIFITEGNSASGSITKSRDVNTQAVFSLRGKPLNCFGLTKKIVYENEEFNAAHPYYNAVCWAYQTRLLRQNDPNAEYDDKVDYQTACVLIRRYAIMAGVDTGVDQTQLRQLLRDAPDLGREAAKAMLWCDEKDITTRDSSLDELLASAGTRISRYQMTSFLFYLCTYELDIGS